MAVPSCVTMDTLYKNSVGLEAVKVNMAAPSFSFTRYSVGSNVMIRTAKNRGEWQLTVHKQMHALQLKQKTIYFHIIIEPEQNSLQRNLLSGYL